MSGLRRCGVLSVLRAALRTAVIAQWRATAAILFHYIHDGAERRGNGATGGELRTRAGSALDLVLVVARVLVRLAPCPFHVRTSDIGGRAGALREPLRLGARIACELLAGGPGATGEPAEGGPEPLGGTTELLVTCGSVRCLPTGILVRCRVAVCRFAVCRAARCRLIFGSGHRGSVVVTPERVGYATGSRIPG